jgi:hypothetical protein
MRGVVCSAFRILPVPTATAFSNISPAEKRCGGKFTIGSLDDCSYAGDAIEVTIKIRRPARL